MNLALNNLERLIFHRTQTNKQANKQTSSSSLAAAASHADDSNFPNSLSPSVPIIYRSRQDFQTISSVPTEFK